MISSFNLKESGIKWVGQIPTDWTTTSVNKAFNITLGKMLQPAASNPNDLIVPYLKAYNVQDGSLKMDKVDTMYCSQKDITTYKLKKGDLLVCEGGEVARSTLITEDMPGYIIQNSLHLVTAREGNLNSYLHFLLIALRHSGFINILVNKATISHFTKDKFSSLKIPLPKFEMQKSIARYLEIKIVEINELVSAKQNLINLLEQQRQSIITEAVTKGLNPNVKMKDSGVEWIGEIPEHWNNTQFRRVTRLQQGLQIAQEERFYEMQSNRFEYITVKSLNYSHHVKEYVENPTNRVICHPEDILLARTGATGLVISGVDGVFHNNFFKINYDKAKLNKEFLVFYLKQKNIKEHFLLMAGTTTIPDLNHGSFYDTTLIIPPLQEQIDIANFLVIEMEKLDFLTQINKIQIEKLKEYRQSLIYEAVTGKIDLSDMQLEEVR